MTTQVERHDRRALAVRQAIEAVRAIEAQHGITREALDRIKPELVKLASRTDLFPPESFGNLPGRPGTIFHLAEDPDGRFALYGSAGAPGKAQPPHNHTTWACIAGVYGDEHNVFYDRVDDRPAESQARLVKTGELTVVKGNACAFLPDDFHTIEVVNGRESLHLHLYGKTLEDLPGRVYFGGSAGGPYQRFMSRPEIFSPRIPPAELKAMIAAGGELAILDPREEGVYAKSHLFLASSCPLSRLELMIGRLVPRVGTRIVLVDDDEKLRPARGSLAARLRLPRHPGARGRPRRVERGGLRGLLGRLRPQQGFRRVRRAPQRHAAGSPPGSSRPSSTRARMSLSWIRVPWGSSR